jgi:hypothetical protein
MPIMKAGADSLTKLGQTIDMVKNVASWLSKKSTYYSVSGTMVEVEVALEKWKSLNKPQNMVVDIALGLD